MCHACAAAARCLAVLRSALLAGNPDLLVMLLTTFKFSHYLLLPKPGGLHLVLHERADARDIVQVGVGGGRGEGRGGEPLDAPKPAAHQPQPFCLTPVL